MTKYENELILNSKSKDGFKKAEEYFFKNSKKCKVCGEPVYYTNYSKILWSRRDKIVKKSDSRTSDSFKTLNGNVYNLCVCEDCLVEKFPNINEVNVSKWFNTTNDFSIFAFGINKEDAEVHNKNNSITLVRMIERYGEDLGKIKWESYLTKQRDTNTFEYKKEKYGWDFETFNDYNKSRSVTLDNMIKRHGEEIGSKKFDEYCAKQKINGSSLSWFVSKYGDIEGHKKYQEVNNKKRQNLINFELRYGKENGLKEYFKYKDKVALNSSFGYSKISQEVFLNLDAALEQFNLTTYFKEKNFEYKKFLSNFGCVFLDYFIEELNLCIEFNGDYFHANPKHFSNEMNCFHFAKNVTAEDIWKKDKDRTDELKSQYNIDVHVIWESDDYDLRIQEIVEYIKDKLNAK